MRVIVLFLLLLIPASALGQPFEGETLYRVTTVRATPGTWQDFMAHWKEVIASWPDEVGERAFWMRHSQGDQWDFLFFFPLDDAGAWLSSAEHPMWSLGTDDRVAETSDLFAYGAPVGVLRPQAESAGFFHVEMFTAIPGSRERLLEQRRMENAFLAGIGRPQNFIFRRHSGVAVDAFTLGFYRDIKHFAESADVDPDLEERSANAAGFDGVGGISPLLRSLIARHHDTLAVAIR
ncbi:MAG: hypothetical protein JJ896_17775 [Rhodothermales bacterium]|nr:hypothetical protein [Rhodothermales bacterium]MBO6781512.1 hypothetical protein [Rhodothermales bacterium]